MNLARKLSTTS